MTKKLFLLPLAAATTAMAAQKPNIVVLFADDISAREFPIYNSSVWTGVKDQSTSDPSCRAFTPVMNQLAEEGCYIKTAWACSVSSPSRAQMMTGRFAYQTKWWHNADQGTYLNAEGKQEGYPLYESSPMMIGRVAQEAGYGTYWCGKTQMAHTDLIEKYGFDEGCYTPGDLSLRPQYTDFYMDKVKGGGYVVKDSGLHTDGINSTSYYWMPSVVLVNDPNNTEKVEAYPNTPESKAKWGLNSYSADIEQEFAINFMRRKHDEKKPFFIYHTAHLGHGQYNFLNPTTECNYPPTPKIEWDGKSYTRFEPNITGDKGVYDLHDSVSEEGIHSHINYIDFVVWRYLEEFKRLGIEDNTVLIICADNGTFKYGKGSVECQKGAHIPMIFYAPCLKMTKQGEQDVLMNVADVLPTVAQIAGCKLQSDYKLDGESILPFLTTKKSSHRDWLYSYRSALQLIRGTKVLKDGYGIWYDVTSNPKDLISYRVIEDWSKEPAELRKEKEYLESILPQFDLYETQRNGPGGEGGPSSKKALDSQKLLDKKDQVIAKAKAAYEKESKK
ncbi:MAG: sulfatase-like hydrolase/transferase [Rikenellaceae bacterium]